MTPIIFPDGTSYTSTPWIDDSGKKWLYSGAEKNRWSAYEEPIPIVPVYSYRHSFEGGYDYLGRSLGLADSDPAWNLTRLTISSAGLVTATEHAVNSWTDRLTATYA